MLSYMYQRHTALVVSWASSAFFVLLELAMFCACVLFSPYAYADKDKPKWKPSCDIDARAELVSYFQKTFPADSSDLRCNPDEPGCEANLKGYLYVPKDAKKGKHPVMIWNHGSDQARLPNGEPNFERDSCEKARLFVEKGFVVLAPERRGHGNSTGVYHREILGPLDDLHPLADEGMLVTLLLAQMEDIRSAVRFVQRQPEVDSSKIAVMGHSFGGIISLFAASEVPGIHAAVDSAGGGLSWGSDEKGPLRDALKDKARKVRVPTFLIQCNKECGERNPTDTLKELLPKKNGSWGKVYDVPLEVIERYKKDLKVDDMPCGRDGAHTWFMGDRAIKMWKQDVFAFLEKHGVAK